MAASQLNKVVWIVNTIGRVGRISLSELNRKWMLDEVDEGNALPRRTFQSWVLKAFDVFGVIIECDRHSGYEYFIANPGVLNRGGLESWLMSTLSVSNSLIENRQLKERIQLEEVPSGMFFVDEVTDAMKRSVRLELEYQKYGETEPTERVVEPYCLKLHHQRWYVVGRDVKKNDIRSFALDRIVRAQAGEETFVYPKDFSPEEYFRNSFGMFRTSKPVEKVLLKVGSRPACYLRDLPLHSSQRELKREAEYSIFELRLRIDVDFIPELLRFGRQLEVLEPQSLREKMKETIAEMAALYE